MKIHLALLLVAVVLGVNSEDPTPAPSPPESPVNKVVIFIEKLQEEIKADTAKEATDYKAYAAWCNATISQATANIQKAEATVEECNRKIEELSGTGAASAAEIKHADESLAENKRSTKEALSIRESELKEYTAVTDKLKEEIKDLEAAKGELLEGQSPTGSFLQKKDSHQTRAIAFLRKFLAAPSASEKLDEEDLQTLNGFVHSASPRKNTQFTQIERDVEEEVPSALDAVISVVNEAVTKFQEELTEAETEETGKKKTFNELMKTLTDEKTALEANLLTWRKSKGADGSELADKTTLRDETSVQKKADQKLLTTTQDSCKEKAYQFSQRSAMRADELKGINLTLEILTANSSKATFTGAAAVSFTQLSQSRATEATQAKSARGVGHEAYRVLKAVASKYRDLKLAQIAVKCKSGGHFDRVIQTIDAQIKHLRDEEKEDVEHRDRCQNEMRDNEASLAQLADTIKKTSTYISRLEGKADETQDELSDLAKEINETKTDIVNLTSDRAAERSDFLVAVKHDKEALALIKAAIKQVTAFFKKNKISLNLAQTQKKEISLMAQAHGYKPAPDAGFEDANYQGGKDSTKALVNMMQMVEEDMAADIKQGQEADAKNQESYEKDCQALKNLLKTQEAKEISLNKQLAELQGEIQSMTDTNSSKTDEHASELEEKENLAVDCDWIKKKFGERRKKRKDEIDGLVSAKGLLAGAEP